MSVQLAPQHKVGMALRTPLLLANATAELLSLLDREVLGAAVAPEIGGHARRPRRIVERPGGFLLEEGRGAFSRSGLRRLLRVAGDLPVIARVPAADPQGAARAVERLAAEGVQAIELDLLPNDLPLAGRTVAHVRRVTGLPLLARVPLGEALNYAIAAAEDGADSLVVAAPPRGMAPLGDPPAPRAVQVHGPLLHPLILQAVLEVADAVDLPVVARGGILTVDDALAYLAAGAVAVAVDSLALVDPAATNEIGQALQRDAGGSGAGRYHGAAWR